MAKGFFVTGTDTGVGKTVVTAALIRAIRLSGLRVGGMKPIETGCFKSEFRVRERVLIPSDGMFLREMADMDDSIDLVAPVRYKNPLAPLTASEIENVPVDIKKIKKAYSELSKNFDVVIIEGIGGLLVPITRDYLVIDLAKDFSLPVIIISRPGLGTINHTLLTVNCAIREGLDIAGIIINYSQPPDGTIAEATNPEVIRQMSSVPLLGIFPYVGEIQSASIEKAALENLDLGRIRKYLV